MANMDTGELYSADVMKEMVESFKNTEQPLQELLTQQNIVEISDECYQELKPLTRQERINFLKTNVQRLT